MKSFVVMDVECYPNHFFVAFKNVKTGTVLSFAITDDEVLTDTQREKIRNVLYSCLIVTFNGRNYDFPMLSYALQGKTPAQLKVASDAIIIGSLKPWDFEKKFGIKLPRDEVTHWDLIEVAPGRASLKIYGGRIHCKRMQDLPFNPMRPLNRDQIAILQAYCINDLDTTIELFHALKPQLDLRVEMSREYQIDLMSKSDAQIAEAVIRKGVEERLGYRISKPGNRAGDKFSYRMPTWVGAMTQPLQEAVNTINSTEFVVDSTGSVIMPAAFEKLTVAIGNGVYRMGIGGLHSSEECVSHHESDGYLIFDRDVTSYYPSIILNHSLYPKHIGPEFLAVYRKIVEDRVAAKVRGEKVKADSLKITINGSFGKFGSRWSILYSPELLIQTTVTGQLALLMLIERLHLSGIRVLSANTDGIVIRPHESQLDAMQKAISYWEIETGFKTEESTYRSIHSRDVNNYIAVKKDGSTKTKGAFAIAEDNRLMKNPTAAVCVEAAIAHLTDGWHYADVIRKCDDIKKFVVIKKVEGGGYKPDGDPLGCDLYLGKAVRWYYATGETAGIHYQSNGNLVGDSTGGRPLMEMPNSLPSDIDYDHYINRTREMLIGMGVQA